jgi:hypothetical protein
VRFFGRRVSTCALLVAGLSIVAVGCGGSTKTVTVTTGDLGGPSADTNTSPAPTPADNGPKITDRAMWQIASDGTEQFKLLSVRSVQSIAQDFDSPIAAVSGARFIIATVEIRNDGRVAVQPFCGGDGSILIDSKDRNYSVNDNEMNLSGNTVCGDDLQPGFRNSFKVLFQVPVSSRITNLAVWNTDQASDPSAASVIRYSFRPL